MTLTTAAILIGALDLGVIAAVAAIMRVPFAIDRAGVPETEATVHAFAAPLPRKLAA